MFAPEQMVAELKSSFSDFYGVKHVFGALSGKAALTLILQALVEIEGRMEVVVPSYTCFSVPAAVVKAGCKNIICDVEPLGTNYDLKQLSQVLGDKTLAVVASHLFGIPSDVDSLADLARSAGAYVIEDCAQAMGAELHGRQVGTLGDVAFFSFGRGKNICAGSGGLVISNNDAVASSLRKKISVLRPPTASSNIKTFCAAFFMSVLSHPSLYWFPTALPFLHLGKTIYSTQFPLARMAASSAGLAKNWNSKLMMLNGLRRQLAQMYRNHLSPLGVLFLTEPDGAQAVYPRFPVVVPNQFDRSQICQELFSSGLGGTLHYPSSIADIAELSLKEDERRNYPNGDLLARLIITLPTHSAVSHSDVQAIVHIFSRIMQRRRSMQEPNRAKSCQLDDCVSLQNRRS